IAEKRGKDHSLVTHYEYDCRHRLIKVIKPTGLIITYTYDAFNRRTSKTVDGKTTEFIWQGSRLIAETDNDKHWQTYLYEPDSYRPLALVHGNAQQDNIKLYWYQNDHLGTPIALTSNMGDTLYECQYNAYGQIINETYHQDDFHALPDNPLRFQGQYYDEETGLHYNLNRYYDPFTGRYITQDPLGILGGLNSYQYAGSDPINWVDPLGLVKVENSGFEGIAGNVEIPNGISFSIEQPKHLANVDGFSQKYGISGGHNADAFYSAAKNYGVKIINENPTGVNGITNVQYQVPALDRAGNMIGYKAEIKTKTIYDPKIFTDQKILDLGQQAAVKGYKEAMSSSRGIADATVNGVTFRIYVDKTTGTVRNFHPK
ncbi:MAG: RHS domain-containing protein, partial [Gilliamella sp.]|uniref:RHS repeat-associated core domain-containing protein n=1 Tax=Gilliamella sp. TaxID=1891236 RepID=UPI0025DD7E28